MVSNIAQSLPQSVGDLFQCISLEEIQLDRRELGRGENLSKPYGRLFSPDTFERPFRKENLISIVGNVQFRIFKSPAGVKVSRVEMAATVEGAVIGDLHDP